MQPYHVVWDWNGTLLDDLDVIIDALNVGIGHYGMPPIEPDEYRDHFTRPVRKFYDSLFGRRVSDMEWADLNKTFHDEYYARVPDAELSVDSLDAMDRVQAMNWSQSLLSMSPEDKLLANVAQRGIDSRFTLIQGLQSETGGLKADHLARHIAVGDHQPTQVVVIGDTPDDASAARHVGASVVMYDGGSHHLLDLHEARAPVAHTLIDAVAIAEQLVASATEPA